MFYKIVIRNLKSNNNNSIMGNVKTTHYIDDKPVELIADFLGTQIYQQVEDNTILYVCQYGQTVMSLNAAMGGVQIYSKYVKSSNINNFTKVIG